MTRLGLKGEAAPGVLSGTTRFSAPPTARIAAWGGLIMAAKVLMPNMPKLLMVKVPPWYSSGASFLARAFSTRPLTSLRERNNAGRRLSTWRGGRSMTTTILTC